MKVKIKNNDHRTRTINGVVIQPHETQEVEIKKGAVLHSKFEIVEEEKKIDKPIIFENKKDFKKNTKEV